MLVGIVSALIAGLMLGLYALPGKYTKDFEEENKWSLFFLLTMFATPLAATFGLMKGVGAIYTELDPNVLSIMVGASFVWGIGVMMWGKAIDYVGLALGFSLFIGTVIVVGSLLPLGRALVDDQIDLPPTGAVATTLVGIAIVLFGVVSNGRAGLTREADEAAQKEGEGAAKPKAYGPGILIAVVGGLMATGFNVALIYGEGPLKELVVKNGNPPWMTALAVMLPVFLSGGVVMTVYFAWQLSAKKAWGAFKTPSFVANLVLILIMAVFHYAASATFAYAAGCLGKTGPVVGYAIFNTTCLVVAVISGILTGEWNSASPTAKGRLYTGLACMVAGVMVLAYAQSLSGGEEASAEEARIAAPVQTLVS